MLLHFAILRVQDSTQVLVWDMVNNSPAELRQDAGQARSGLPVSG